MGKKYREKNWTDGHWVKFAAINYYPHNSFGLFINLNQATRMSGLLKEPCILSCSQLRHRKLQWRKQTVLLHFCTLLRASFGYKQRETSTCESMQSSFNFAGSLVQPSQRCWSLRDCASEWANAVNNTMSHLSHNHTRFPLPHLFQLCRCHTSLPVVGIHTDFSGGGGGNKNGDRQAFTVQSGADPVKRKGKLPQPDLAGLIFWWII